MTETLKSSYKSVNLYVSISFPISDSVAHLLQIGFLIKQVMNLGGYLCRDFMEATIILQLKAYGIIFVVAAGNDEGE